MKPIRLHARGGPESLRFEGARVPTAIRCRRGPWCAWVRGACGRTKP
jgi:hypothetical protein